MVRNLMLIFGLSLAVAAFGCESESTDNGDAGTGGGGGTGGNGGSGGNGGDSVAPACDNAADIAAGDPDVTACATAAAITNLDYCPGPHGTGTDSSGLTTCLVDGGATQSEACLDCWADLSCCTLNECSVLADINNPCSAPPVAGDPCDLCIQEKCQPAFDSCGETGTGGSGAGGSGAGGSGAGGTSP